MISIQGKGVSTGVAIGPLYFYQRAKSTIRRYEVENAEAEWSRFKEAQAKAVESNPAYGSIICRCETVTEAEIRAAVRRPVGASTVDGVKRRTRAGMGRCQGGFCMPRVAEIIADELGISVSEVTKSGPRSPLLAGSVQSFLKEETHCEE